MKSIRTTLSLVAVLGLLMAFTAVPVLAQEADDYPPEVDDVVDEDVDEQAPEVEAEVDEDVAVQAEALGVTGGNVVPLLLAGLLLALVGALLLVLVRRRRVDQPS